MISQNLFQRLFRRFFKPKWEHRKPEVRKQAVAALDVGEEQTRTILAQVARDDAEPEVRRVAIKRLADLGFLQEIARSDRDAGNRELAGQRFLQLLAGNGADAPPLDRRAEVLAQMTEPKTLEFIALSGKEPELRLAALQRVGRDALFGDLAIDDPDPQVRLAALERITQKSTLERVVKMTRNRDKRVSRIARDRLAVAIEEEERPARARAQREHICAGIETLGRTGNWERDQAMFERLDTQWQQLEGVPEADLNERFQQARERFLSLFEEHRIAEAERQRQEHVHASVRAQKRALCEEAETLLEDLRERQMLDGGTDVPAILETMQARWAQTEAEIGRLPEPEEQQLRDRFARALKGMRARHQELRKLREADTKMRERVSQAQALLAADTPVSERQVKDLEREWQALERPTALTAAPTLERSFDEAVQGLRARLKRQREQRDQALERLHTLLPEIEATLEAGELKKAKSLLGQGQKLAKVLTGLAPDQLSALEPRLQAASAKARQLQDWQRWATTREKEKLCAEVEALIGPTAEPVELDRQIREARAAWKRLSASEPESAQLLWERFNAACTKAYEPCQVYFEEQAKQRQENLTQKQALCERVERYEQEADWDHIDWKALEELLHSMRQEWNSIGPTDRKAGAGLSKRFNAVTDRLAQHLGEERERNAAKKLALVERIEALVESLGETKALRDAIRKAREAQGEWKAVGSVPRRQEQELWKRFRAACDAIFERRKQQVEAQEAERAANLERKQAFCAQVEELGQLEGEALAAAQGQVGKAQAEWDTVGPVPKEAAEPINQRFREACERFFHRVREHQEAVDRERLGRLKEKAGLCAEVEALAQSEAPQHTPEEVRQRVESAQERWQALLPLEDRLEQPLRERFEKACAVASPGAAGLPAPLASLQQANLEAKEALCIRMEILAGIESPPEAAEARLRYQVGRLSKGMRRGRGTSAEESNPRTQAIQLEEGWYLTGNIPPDSAEPLEQRFQRAKEAFYAKERPQADIATP